MSSIIQDLIWMFWSFHVSGNSFVLCVVCYCVYVGPDWSLVIDGW